MARMIGVFGGTFDPVHWGHLILADEARAAFDLSRILWVLTPRPPHKPDRQITALRQRLEMLTSVIGPVEGFELSKADIDRDPPHFAIGTMQWLKSHGPQGELMYLMGSDSLQELPDWYAPADFVAACDWIGVMRRPGAKIDLDVLETAIPGLSTKVRFFNAPLIQISSREIRQRVREDRPFRYFTLPQVADYIRARRLYQ